MKFVLVCAVLALAMASCVASVATPSAAPTPSATTVGSPAPTPAPARWVVYFARDLASPIAVTLDGPAPAARIELRVRQRMELLAVAPRSGEGGAFNVLPAMTARLASVIVVGDLATLDYLASGDEWGLGGSSTLRALIQQVIFTASEEPGIARVLITQNGGSQAVIGGEGLVISGPQSRAGLGYEGLTPSQAARVIRMSVTGARPLLIPNGISDDWTAAVRADSSTFSVTYTDASGAKTVTLAIALANPPLPGAESSQAAPSFHADRLSLYQVAVAANPRSQRWLLWTETGAWSLPGSWGVPYFLSATGLTDMEFWRVANSLHPNQI